jgi:hypothetical protein
MSSGVVMSSHFSAKTGLLLTLTLIRDFTHSTSAVRPRLVRDNDRIDNGDFDI